MAITDEDKQALLNGSATIPFKINIVQDGKVIKTLTENSIVNLDYEDFRYVDTSSLVIGQFVARKVVGTLDQIYTEFEIEDTELELQMGISYNGTTNYYSLGNFLVTKPSTDDVKDKTTFEALDYTKKFNKTFDSSRLDFPCTASQLAQYCCNECGVELATPNFTNSDFVITNNQYETTDSYRNVMQDIGKLSYSWVRIGWDNKCYIDFSVPIDTINDYDKIMPTNYYDLSYQRKPFGPVNRVVIGMTNVEGENAYVEDSKSIEQNGLCELQIMDNNLTYTPELRKLVKDSAKKLFGLTYTPLEINTTGHPWLLGDELIEVNTVDNQKLYTIPLDRTIAYKGHIKTKLTSSADTRIETEYKSTGTLENEVKKTRIIVDKQNQTIQEVVENVDTYNDKISEVKQSVDKISQQVSQISDLTRDGTTEAALLNLARVNAGSPVEIIIRPIDEDISYLYPSKDLFPSDLTHLKIRNILFTNTTTKETFTYTLPMDLWYLDKDTYDEFHLDYATSTCEIIQRVDWNNNQDKYKLDKEVIHTFEFPKIYLTSGDYTISLPGYDTGYMYVKLMVQNQITNQFATKAELNSKIEQSESDINIQVSAQFEKTQETIDKKANSSDVNAQLELKVNTKDLASEIDAVADKINLTGLTTVNKNFQILKDGSIVAKNGSFTGNIYLNDGSAVVGGKGLLSVLTFRSSYTWDIVGFNEYQQEGSATPYVTKKPLIIEYYIPTNFTIEKAYVILNTTPINTSYHTKNNSTGAYEVHETIGTAKKLKLYGDVDYVANIGYGYGTEIFGSITYDITEEIPNAFGVSEYTPSSTSPGTIDEKISTDLIALGTTNKTDYLSTGRGVLGIATTMSNPTLTDPLINKDVVENSCIGIATLYIYGYMQLPQ